MIDPAPHTHYYAFWLFYSLFGRQGRLFNMKRGGKNLMIYELYGVGLLIESPSRRILVGKERRDKPVLGVEAGMWSNPWETRLFGESRRKAWKRLPEEEFPGVLLPGFTVTHVGVYHPVPTARLDMYLTHVDAERLPTMSSDILEVSDHRWVTVEEALELPLRPGAREVLADHLKRCRAA